MMQGRVGLRAAATLHHLSKCTGMHQLVYYLCMVLPWTATFFSHVFFFFVIFFFFCFFPFFFQMKIWGVIHECINTIHTLILGLLTEVPSFACMFIVFFSKEHTNSISLYPYTNQHLIPHTFDSFPTSSLCLVHHDTLLA